MILRGANGGGVGGGLPLIQFQLGGSGSFPIISEVLACPFLPHIVALKESHFFQFIVWGSLLPQVCSFSCVQMEQKESA